MPTAMKIFNIIKSSDISQKNTFLLSLILDVGTFDLLTGNES